MNRSRQDCDALGSQGEQLVTRGLIARWGWNVFNCNGARWQAPVHQGHTGALITPDLDLVGHGVRRFAEVKTKSAASMTRKTGQYEHGMCWRNYQHYLDIGARSGTPVWLFIYQVNVQEILYAPLHGYLEAMARRTSDTKQCGHGMAFFYADAFRRAALTEFVAGRWDDSPLILRQYRKLTEVPHGSPAA